MTVAQAELPTAPKKDTDPAEEKTKAEEAKIEEKKAEDTSPSVRPQATAADAAMAARFPEPLPSQGGTSDAINSFSSEKAFGTAYRMAKALSFSSMVPKEYQSEAGIPNCMIALELANRIGASVFMVMQNLDVIHGRPGWRAKFLTATANSSGKFSRLKPRFEGKEGTAAWGCRMVATELSTGEELVGPRITMQMANDEGWSTKAGSKWKTMPELMLIYRASAFWTRVYAPEISLGMDTAEEVQDYVPGPIEVHQALSPDQPEGKRISLKKAPAPMGQVRDVIVERIPGAEG